MEVDQITSLVQENLGLVVAGVAGFFALIFLIMAISANGRAGRRKKEIAELTAKIGELEAANRSTARAAAPKPSEPARAAAPTERAQPTPMPEVPRVGPATNGGAAPNMFETQQGISDLSRYRKKN